MGSKSPMGRGNFKGGERDARCEVQRLSEKTAEPIEMPFGIWTQVGTGKHVLGGVHTSATWQIPLNRQRAAAMRPVVKLLDHLLLLLL